MTLQKPLIDLHFLSGGGEMGQLTREKDWSKTSVGDPYTWPQSLRTTLGIILNSRFPMFLWWGPELICFYNDAYRPSLGNNGKHPVILGQSAEQAWPEIWTVIKPLIDQVLAGGESTWSEDQLIPIYRNGKLEDVYWTFSYSPVNDESGKVSGVLVTCSETTEKVITLKSLEESNKRYLNNILQAPVAMCILKGKEYVVEIANPLILELWGKTPEQVMNKPLFEGLPEAKGQGLEILLDSVYTTGEKFTANERPVNLPRNGKIETTYINFTYEAFREPDGTVSGIMAIAHEVTSEVMARVKIEESEKGFRDLAEKLNIVIDASELGTWEWDLQTDEINYSGRYYEIFGYKDAFSFGHEKHIAHLHPEDVPKRNAAVEEALQTGSLNYELRIIWNDHSVHWIEAKGKVFYDQGDQPAKLIGTIRDITNEKNNQQELLENEQRFRLLADSMPQQIWTADLQGNLNYYNRAVYTYSGLTPGELGKVGWIEIVHPDDRDENIRQWTHAVATGEDFLFEHRFRRHDGEYRWQLSRAIPQKDAEGKIQMWVGTSTDIQDQKTFASDLERNVRERTKELARLNESLKKSEERYHLMVEEVQDYAILYLNREGIVENWNKGAEKIKGYRADEIIGKSFSSFYTAQDRESHLPETLLAQAVKTGRAVQQGQRIRKDGSIFWASVVITAVHDEQNNVIGFSKVTHDLTDKKAADDALKINAEQLAQKNSDLEKMNVELQSFAYVSSHDLQEPLRKIQTFASRILSREMHTLSENGKDYFRRMQDAASRMQILIQDLLAYSHTSTAEGNFETADLAELVKEVQNDIKETLAEKQAVIEMGAMCKANIIRFQFRQLLHNLIGNALKFAKHDVPPLINIQSNIVKADTLQIQSLAGTKMYCHISISDNGIGFDTQYRDRIFEVFQRLHGKEEYSGTGIGLAIVKKIVENHNGIITASGEVNKGARFDIYIPC